MKTSNLFAVAIVTLASLPLMAQQVGANTQQSSSASAAGADVNDSANAGANATFSPGRTQANGATDAATQASAANYAQMRSVTGELTGKLNTKSARVGQPVVLKTTEKTQTAGGMVIPKGSRLVGRVTEVQAHSKQHANSQMGIEFDRAELENGQSLAIHSVIESVSEPARVLEAEMQDEEASDGGGMDPDRMGPGSMDGDMMAGGGMAGGAMAGGRGRMGGALDAAANVAGKTAGTLNATGHVAGSAAGATSSLAARATGIPGVMLSGDASGSASGVLSEAKKNFSLDSGTQMVVGIAAAGK